MRARLAIYVSNIKVQLREILLRDKAPEFLLASAKGTVPVLVTHKEVIEEEPRGGIFVPEKTVNTSDIGKGGIVNSEYVPKNKI